MFYDDLDAYLGQLNFLNLKQVEMDIDKNVRNGT